MTAPMQAPFRAAVVTLLEAYATAASLKLAVYRARPASIHLPHAFIDRMSGTFSDVGIVLQQTTPQAEVVVVHGLFDSGDAVDQRDAFVDGFVAYVATQYHAAGANTLITVASVEDEPDYTADWILTESRRFYATRITLEGFASG